MPPIQLLIKPASGACNMRCKYCFYFDEMKHRETSVYPCMSRETLEAVVRKTLQTATDRCLFGFQGGEPTLAGLSFYRELDALVKKYNTRNLEVSYTLQTNGYAVDDAWARFFAERRYLIGLSLDGPKNIHDRYRVDAAGNGTYDRVMHAAQLLRQYGAQFNILCVVTGLSARNIPNIYNFYKKRGLDFQQYIPCLEPIGEIGGGNPYSLSSAQYGAFLRQLFDLWYKDCMDGNYRYNRTFENWVAIARGYRPESCGMVGECLPQLVVEADGTVYPCDFYAMDGYALGNLNVDSFGEIERRRRELKFIEQSRYIDEDCRKCRWLKLCRGGCRRNREPFVDGHPAKNVFCGAYMSFFNYAAERIFKLAREYKGM